MAKKAKKKGKKDTSGADPVGAVRTAVERTFQATADSAQSTRTRAQDLVDEVAGAATRVREMIEEIRVLEDLKGLRGEVEALARRVAALESPGAKPAARGRSTASRSTASRSTASRSSGTRAASGGARKTSGGTTRKTSASTARKASGSTASRSASTRSAAGRKTAGSTRRSSSAAKKSS